MKNIIIKVINLFVFLFLSVFIFAQDNNTCNNLITPGGGGRTITELPPIDPVRPKPPIIPNIPRFEEERLVFWVHGFGGDATSWDKAAHISDTKVPYYSTTVNEIIGFPARQIKSLLPTYASDAGLDILSYGNTLNDQIEDSSIAKEQSVAEAKTNFCISHSFGGLITRRAEVEGNANDGFRAGGIVTFGTPHLGAVLADNSIEVNNQTGAVAMAKPLNNFINKLTFELSTGKLTELQYDPDTKLIVRILLKYAEGEINELRNSLVNSLTESIPFFSSLATTGLSLRTDSRDIAELNSHKNNTNNVAVYGIEPKKLSLWKMAYWNVNSVNNPPFKTELYEKYFGASGEKGAYGIYNTNLSRYEAKKLKWKNRENDFRNRYMGAPCFGTQIALIPCVTWYNKWISTIRVKNAYDKGVRWWKNSSKYWDLITGASTFEVQSVPQCACELGPKVLLRPCPTILEDIEECTPNGNYVNQIVKIYKPNDGIVLQESAVAFPALMENVPPIEMWESSHYQMRNDENTQTTLMGIFGPPDYDPNDGDPATDYALDPLLYFYTEVKE